MNAVRLVQASPVMLASYAEHDEISAQLDYFIALTTGYGVGLDTVNFWTYARRSQIYDLPTEMGAKVLRIIIAKFEGQLEGFSGASGQQGFSAGASSSAATAAKGF